MINVNLTILSTSLNLTQVWKQIL